MVGGAGDGFDFHPETPLLSEPHSDSWTPSQPADCFSPSHLTAGGAFRPLISCAASALHLRIDHRRYPRYKTSDAVD